MKHFKLSSSLSPQQCVARLREAGDVYASKFDLVTHEPGSKPVMGMATPSRLSICLRRRRFTSLATFLHARMRDDAGGTTIDGRFGMRPSTIAFLWFGGAILPLTVVVAAFAEARRWSPGAVPDGELAWFAVVAMSVFGACASLLALRTRLHAPDDQRILEAFMVETLGARVVTEAVQVSDVPLSARDRTGAA